MKVLYFSQDYTPHDHRFLQALAGTEHQVSYLRLEDSGRALETRPVPEGIKTIDWWGGRRRVRWWEFPRARGKLREVLRRTQPDLVHAGPVQGPALLTAAAGFHPLVTMSWGSDLLVDSRRGPGKWAAGYTLARTDALVCDSLVVQGRAEALGRRPEAIVRFPWGVDLAHFAPDPLSRLRKELGWESAFVALSTRAWERLQGVDVLVRGFIIAAKSHPELRLIMLGGGALEVWIREQLEQAGLTEGVHFAGQIGFEALPRYYRAADLYLSASRSDGSSISLLEAMACGLPALVSDIPGNREWVQHGINGWWFRDGISEDLAEALGKAIDQRESIGGMGSHGRAVAEARGDWSRNFPNLLRAYKRAGNVLMGGDHGAL